jgi:hypothetical protein
MSVDIEKLIIDTVRTIGYSRIIEENISRNNILDVVSARTGISRSNIKKMCDYKKIIDNEIHIMEEYENENSDDEPLNAVISKIKSLNVRSNNEYDSAEEKDYSISSNSDMDDMNDIDELPDMRFRDILRPGAGGVPAPIADWLTVKDLENLSTVNKATRESAILELKRKNTILSLNSVKSEKYINNTEYRSSINSILSKYNKKLEMVIIKKSLFELIWIISDIENILQSLELKWLDINDITPIEKLTNLQSLKLTQIDNLIDITPLEKLTNLQSLELQELQNLTNIKPLEKLTNLKSLILNHLSNLTDIKPLEKLTKLQSLKLKNLYNLIDIKPLEKLTNLKSLKLRRLFNLTDIKPLEKLTQLQSLILDSSKLTDITPLEKLTKLQSLELENLRDLTNIKPLEKLTNLQSLELVDLTDLTNIKPLEKLTNLKSLELTQLKNLIDIKPLEKLTNLSLKIYKDREDKTENITIDKLLDLAEKSKRLYLYEYYDGLQIGIDDTSYLIPEDEKAGIYTGVYQDVIFEKIKSLDNLVDFSYNSRFCRETSYDTLFVNKNLLSLEICNMDGINSSSQLGNIEELNLEYIKYKDIKNLPKTLGKIFITSYEGEEEEYEKLIKYFKDNEIKYYIDNI